VDRLHEREERRVRTNRSTYEPRHRKSGPPRVGGGDGGGRRARDLRALVDGSEPDDVADLPEERSA